MSKLRKITLLQDDITSQDVDAIVNAANNSLLGGGGVDGAIHHAAGPDLLAECRKLDGCRTGEAKATGGYALRSRYVIHTVGPIYGSASNAAELLASCYRRAMEVGRDLGISSIAFPSISTGVYAYPIEEACPIALKTVLAMMDQMEKYREVRFVLFSAGDLDVYRRYLEELRRQDGEKNR